MCETFCSVDLPKCFDDPTRINLDGAALLVAECEVPWQGLDVAVENDPDYFSGLVNRGTARTSADDVRCRNKVQWGLEIEFPFSRCPPFRQLVWRLVAMRGGMFEGAPMFVM